MNRDGMYLTHWYPGWLRGDDVDLENQSSLTADLRAFIRDSFGKETFVSTIPFRIIGHVTDHPKFPNEDITIYPIADVHLGSQECMEQEFIKFISPLVLTTEMSGKRESLEIFFRVGIFRCTSFLFLMV